MRRLLPLALLALMAATGLPAGCVADRPSQASTELALYRWCFVHGLGDYFVKVVEIGSLADANPEETMLELWPVRAELYDYVGFEPPPHCPGDNCWLVDDLVLHVYRDASGNWQAK